MNIKMVCPHCGSDNVTASLTCEWDVSNQRWFVCQGSEEQIGLGYCDSCKSYSNYLKKIEIEPRTHTYDTPVKSITTQSGVIILKSNGENS